MGCNSPKGKVLWCPSTSPKPSRLLGRCFPDMVPGTSKKKPTRRCVVCWANGKRKEPSYWCSNCEKALCVVPCFKVYHTDKNLKILKKITNFAIIVNKSCISSLHPFFIPHWEKPPSCLHPFSCFIETRNNGHLNTQGRLHQQPRKDPVKGLANSLEHWFRNAFCLIWSTTKHS